MTFLSVKEKEICKLALKKPTIKPKILAVITQDLPNIMALKFFEFFNTINKNYETILLYITADGLIFFYKLKKKYLEKIPQIDISKLSFNPFIDLEEKWIQLSLVSNEKPIKDYFFCEKNFNLYILNIDNHINLYALEETKKAEIYYKKMISINLEEGQNLNKIIVSRNEKFIFCLYDDSFTIYNNSRPFHRIYFFNFNDIHYLNTFQDYLKEKEEDVNNLNYNFNGNTAIKRIVKDDYYFNMKQNEKLEMNIKRMNLNKTKNSNFYVKNEIEKNKKTKDNDILFKNENKFGKKTKNQDVNTSNSENEDLLEEVILETSDFIESSEEDEIENYSDLEDFVDLDEKIALQDNNYIGQNIQNALFSLDENFIIFSFFNYTTKRYYLMKFYLDYFYKNYDNYEFFKKCHKGQYPELCKIIMSSYEKIFYCLPPALYIKNNFFTENEDPNFLQILFSHINTEDIKNNVYCPIAVINKKTFYLIKLNKNFEEKVKTGIKNIYDSLIDKYEFLSENKIGYNGLTFKWLYNNTILISSEYKFMKMLKFTGDQFLMGLILKRNFELIN